VLVLLLAGPPADARAQSTGNGSIYSRFGVGTLNTFSSSQTQALGGGGYALRTLNYNPAGNPALWSDQVYTRLNMGARLQTIDATDASGASSELAGGTLEALQFSFPLYQRQLGVGIVFQPYSLSNYQIQEVGRVATGAFRTDTLNYQTDFEGVGGLQLLRGGLGGRINEVLRVGASLDVIFGILESQRSTVLRRPGLSEPAAGTRDALVTDGTRLSGVTGTLGGHLALADVFAADDAFSLGASFTFPTNLSGERIRTLDESLSRDTLDTAVDGALRLPWEVRVGAAYQPDERWTFVADGLFAPWSTADSDFDGAAIEGEAPSPFPEGGAETLTDRWRVSAGAEVVPAGTDNLAGFFARIAYRIGAYAERLNVRPNRRTNVGVFAGTAGLSFPTSLSGTRIDLNLSAGRRGTTEANLVRDTFYELSLHVSIGERWFLQRKLR
jgi:hypothetical protein